MSDTTDIRQALRAFVQENFLYMRPDLSFADDDSLLANGVIDSLGVMEIVGFVEDRWNFHIEPDDVTERNFGSLGAIAAYVAGRGGAESPAG